MERKAGGEGEGCRASVPLRTQHCVQRVHPRWAATRGSAQETQSGQVSPPGSSVCVGLGQWAGGQLEERSLRPDPPSWAVRPML